VIGLDGVVAQQENYKKSGFSLAYAPMSGYGGTVAPRPSRRRRVIPLTEVPFAAVDGGTMPRSFPGAACGVPARLDRHAWA
jgi:hypothetical protein